MATKGQLKIAMRFVEQIKREDGRINKFDLMDKLSMSISTYNQLKPYVEHRFGHYVEYDRPSQSWIKKEVIDVVKSDDTIKGK